MNENLDKAWTDRTKALVKHKEDSVKFLHRYYELEYYLQNFAAGPVPNFSVFHNTVFKPNLGSKL